MGRPIRGLGLAAALAATLLVAACGQAVTPAARSTTATPDPPQDTEVGPPAPSTTTVPYPDLSAVADGVADAVAAASRGTDAGFVLFDRQPGQELASADRDTPYYTASVVKLLIAIDEVRDTDGGWALPDAGTVDDLTDMLAGSNDGIASELWERNGGNEIVTRTAALIGLTHTTPPADPTQWGMAKTSAADVVATYEYLEDTVPDDVAQPLLTALGDARNPADDGWDQYFGIPDGLPGTSWQVKQGWMVLRDALVLNTTGVVNDRYVVVLLTQQPLVSSAKGRAAVTAGITTLAPLLKQLSAT
ncbi:MULTISPECIES: hypothetical protein [unclassified Amycolatopsis]|uniref:hypothetical protein n=1 Tax=unclassified Amycolatopsis TaxID=2618356 RepID=UPI002E21434F|nr:MULTISPECIES: hypothetical protein [unclassified Amycolatopsis]